MGAAFAPVSKFPMACSCLKQLSLLKLHFQRDVQHIHINLQVELFYQNVVFTLFQVVQLEVPGFVNTI